jgi:hypothetical protein
LLVERVAQQSLGVQPAQKGPERGNDLLHAEAVVGLRGSTQVGVDLNRANAPKDGRPFVKSQELKERTNAAAVTQDRLGAQPTYLTQVSRQGFELPLCV